MPKVKVAALLGDQLQQEATTSVPDLPTDVVRHVGTREVPQPGGAAARDPQPLRAVPETSADSDSAALPKYRRMERKNTRLRGDQLDKLSQLTRRLQRTEGRAERITDNTLIRVAVDMLLAASDKLTGRDEEELRAAAVRQVVD